MYHLTSKIIIKVKSPLIFMNYMWHNFCSQNLSIFLNWLYQVALGYHEFHCHKEMNSLVVADQHVNVATKSLI